MRPPRRRSDGGKSLARSGRFDGVDVPEAGWISEDLTADFPALRLLHITVPLAEGATSKALKRQVAELERYFSGTVAMELRTRPATSAQRVFLRQIGLDPDTTLTPVEAIVRDRLVQHRFESFGFVRDALRIATMQTEAPVAALDASAVLGPLGLSLARQGEQLEGAAAPLQEGHLVVADVTRALALAHDPNTSPSFPDASTTQVTLYVVVVPGMPPGVANEALWVAASLLSEG